MRDPKTYTFLIDVELKRPGCAILQAVAGCRDHNDNLYYGFNPGTWLTAPTDNMRIIRGTRDEWEAFIKVVNDTYTSGHQKGAV